MVQSGLLAITKRQDPDDIFSGGQRTGRTMGVRRCSRRTAVMLTVATLSLIALGLLTFSALAEQYLASYNDSRVAAHKFGCIANLNRLERMKRRWAREHERKPGAAVRMPDLVPAYNPTEPHCPSEGTYTLGKIGEPATCSLKNWGHRLVQ
jgi:hypothetical protein